MRFRPTAVLSALLLTALVSCSGALPNSATPSHLAERHHGTRTATTPLAAVIQDNDIRSPDLAAPVPLQQLQRELGKSDRGGRFAGITYDLTRGNALADKWLVQSPALWGVRANAVPPGHSDHLVDLVRRLTSQARQRIDIALLAAPPDGRFLEALNAGLAEAAARGRVEVRIVIGHYPSADVDAAQFLKKLHAAPQLAVHVASMRSCAAPEDCDGWAWNHAKILAVDGRVAFVGGHNLWSDDYLSETPVHDLSMVVQGPAAASAVRFIDELWRFVCASAGARKPAVQWAGTGGTCPQAPRIDRTGPAGTLDVLAIGRLGVGITTDFANHSELARDLLFGAARRSIRIAQQDLGFRLGRSDTIFPESTLERLVDLIERGGDVYIVLSNPGALGKNGSTYSNDVPVEALARRLRQIVEKRHEKLNQRGMVDRSPQPGPDPVNALLCSRLHIAPLRFGPDDKWPGGATFAQHTKFYMVDDRVFYIGSDNMYPVNLQEFGYILDDRRAVQEVLDTWWQPLWQGSSRAALSGPGVERCIFRELVKPAPK